MKILNVGDTSPVSSIKRIPEAAVIPPYTFIGRLTAGTSPWWSPHSHYELTQGYVQAASAGASEAGLAFMKVSGGFNTNTANHIVLGAVSLAAGTLKSRFDLSGLIGPYDSIYIASFSDSGHTGVVVQLLGELV